MDGSAEEETHRPLLVVVEDEFDFDADAFEDGPGPDGWGREVLRLLRLSLPLSGASVLAYCGRAITLAQVGALGSMELSALALASTFYNVTGLSLVMGIVSGAETFIGQAAGMRQSGLIGLVLQRAVALGWLTALAPLALWTHAPALLRLLGQQEGLASLAGHYVQWLSPALLFGCLNSALTVYLAMQRVVVPLTLVSALLAASTPAANAALISAMGGLPGVAAASVALQAGQSALLVALAVWHNAAAPAGAKPWAGFSTEAFSQVPSYLAVALPATGLMVVDWWAAEVITLLAGLLPDASTAVGACGVLFAINALSFFCVEGVAYAVKIRVARLLGARRAAAARRSLQAGLLLGAAWAALLAVGLTLGRRRVAAVFSSDPAVIEAVVGAVPWLVAMICIGNASNVMNGALRGCGRQRAGFAASGLAYWAVGVPLAAYLSLCRNAGVPGLWAAMACAGGVQLAALSVVLSCQVDWRDEVTRSRSLVRSQSSRTAAAVAARRLASAAAAAGEGGADGLDAAPSGSAGDQNGGLNPAGQNDKAVPPRRGPAGAAFFD